ncbi:MAG: NAD(+)/NADH kinase [Clostridia bacterium]|nr:NAD(+)/NADH kinase [Clostridia bacterium]
MKFGIISNTAKDPDGLYLLKVSETITRLGGTVIMRLAMGKDAVLNDKDMHGLDIILSMGGDGTFLNIARKTASLGIPILGINIGSLGFLAGTEVQNIESAIKSLLSGEYTIDGRMMVKASVERDGRILHQVSALNDIVISRGNLSRIVNLKTYIDDSYVDTFPGDGLIVSSPTGSTGYSLSAGGPVIDHNMELMVLTPICPHIMHAKSFVSRADSRIRIVVNESPGYSCNLTADGQMGMELYGNDSVTITKSECVIRMVKLGNDALYNTLRNKIYYRNGDKNETQQAH